MYCSKCGKPNKDDAVFCEHCGARIEKNEVPMNNQPVQPGYSYGQQPIGNPNPKNKKGIIIVCAILAVLVVAGAGGYFVYNQYTEKLLAEQLQEEWEEQSDVEDFDEDLEREREERKQEREREERKREREQEQEKVYVANYNMKIRSGPSYSADEVGGIDKGDSVTVYETQKSSNNSTWGRIGQNRWICIFDDEYYYLSER